MHSIFKGTHSQHLTFFDCPKRKTKIVAIVWSSGTFLATFKNIRRQVYSVSNLNSPPLKNYNFHFDFDWIFERPKYHVVMCDEYWTFKMSKILQNFVPKIYGLFLGHCIFGRTTWGAPFIVNNSLKILNTVTIYRIAIALLLFEASKTILMVNSVSNFGILHFKNLHTDWKFCEDRVCTMKPK